MTEEDYSSFLNSIHSLTEAQRALNQALVDIHARRREAGGGEITPYDYEDAQTRLTVVLGNVPPGVSCVTVDMSFPRVSGDPTQNIEYEARVLQSLLGQLDPSLQETAEIMFKFTVRPNYYPAALARESHGSYARSLMGDVVETLKIGYSSLIHVLEVKPWGAPGGMAGIWALNAKPFRVPLRYVTDIQFQEDRLPLTDYFEGDWSALNRVSVSYDAA